MGLQLSVRKKDKNPKYPGPGYPPYPGMPAPFGAYWPGAGYGPVPVPANYNGPGFIPPALPWPTTQTNKRRRKRATTSGRRRKRSNTDTMGNLPAGFVPNGYNPSRMPQPVVPSRAVSQGQPPPLFTPGNNAQQLAIFSSPQIPARAGGGSSHGHGSNLRAPTPFIRPRDNVDDDDEEDDSDEDGPVIPSVSNQGGHRRGATMPAMQLQVQPYMPQRRNNPLPQPPRSFDRTPFKRLADLPHFEVPTQTTIIQMVQPTAGLAGIGANGANSTQPKKSRLLRALSLRGNKQSVPLQSGTAAGPAVPVTRIVPVILSSQNTAGPSSARSAGTSGVLHNPANPTRPANSGNLTHSASPTNLSTQSSPEPPLLFKNRGPYRAFVPFSEHPVVYQGKVFPTAQHLFEAKRFPENQQDCWELIRTSKTVNEIYENASKLCQRGLERPDWSVIFLREMEEVSYLKLIQHEPVRSLLLRTGNVPLVYCANDPYWGNGEDENGANKLGEVLQRLRDRLRADGYA